ncbi:MAG: primase alpha helix C-terminal domain-containing protein, partial [Candidatus Limivicinus sp.]|nr:primase alpha helix C-terminal domain-containing protein [Candidatus Limivicinus sp.]
MVENTPITVYTAECIGNAANCLYPNEVKITDELSAKLAFSTDMVCARYKNNYRNTANFEVANALPGDCDNDHSDEPADWVTPEDIADLFADVSYVLHFSRHHMKPKGEKGARPRFHIVFLTDPEQDADRYTALKQRLLTSFPFFDANAMDAARFLFGTEDPQVIYHPGTITLNAFLDDLENEQAFANMGRAIPEGSRNSTMSRIGARIIKRYGDTPEAKELFLQAAGQCSPPLEERELESIWAGKQRLYAKMCNQPGYIPPDAYNSTGPVVWDTPIPFDEYDLPTFPVDALPEVI